MGPKNRLFALWETYETRARVWLWLFAGACVVLALSLVTTLRLLGRPREVIRIGCDGIPQVVRSDERAYAEPDEREIRAFAAQFAVFFTRADSYSVVNDYVWCAARMEPELQQSFKDEARKAIAVVEALKRRSEIEADALSVALEARLPLACHGQGRAPDPSRRRRRGSRRSVLSRPRAGADRAHAPEPLWPSRVACERRRSRTAISRTGGLVMARLLPSRYTPEVNDRIVNEAARILAQAAASGKPRQRPTLALAAILLPVVVMGGLIALDGAAAPGGRVSFDRSSVISAEATGTAAKARDFLPGRAPAEPTRPLGPPAAPNSLAAKPQTHKQPITRAARAAPKSPPFTNGAGQESLASHPAEDVLFDGEASFAAVVSAAEPAKPIVLNVGVRIPIVLAQALTTGATAVPLSARVASDVTIDSRVAVAAGTPVIGDAFAVQENDRVQAILTAIVVDRRTLPLQALVLGGDGELGFPGKVLKKGKTKGTAGRAIGLLGSAANVASLELFATKPGLGEAAALELTQDATRGLDRLTERWSVSDKVVRVPAGAAAYVYLRSDLELP